MTNRESMTAFDANENLPTPRHRHCLTCGNFGPVQEHHVAGWRNDADLTVTICPDCHRVVTRLASAAGIDLREGTREPVDRLRAIVLGSVHLVELFLRRHPSLMPDLEEAPRPEDARLVGRWLSALLDLGADPRRVGRWTPDPRAAYPLDIEPSPRDPAHTLDDWHKLLTELERIFETRPTQRLDDVRVLDLSQSLRSPLTATGSDPEAIDLFSDLGIVVRSITDRVLRPGAPLTELDTPVVLAVAASALRLVMATFR